MNQAIFTIMLTIVSVMELNLETDINPVDSFEPVCFYEVNLVEVCAILGIKAIAQESMEGGGLLVGSCSIKEKNLFMIIRDQEDINRAMIEIAEQADKSADDMISDMKDLIISYVKAFSKTTTELEKGEINIETLKDIKFLKESLEKMDKLVISLRADICQVGFYKPLFIGRGDEDLKKESVSYEIMEALVKNENLVTRIEKSMNTLRDTFNSLMNI